MMAVAISILMMMPRVMAQPYYQAISQEPKVGIWHEIITPEEAAHLIQLGSAKIERSTVVDSSGKAGVVDVARTSSTAYLQAAQDPIVTAIEERLASLVGTTVECLEPLQIVHYAHGQEYRPHYDYFNPEHMDVHHGNQRRYTLLIYLNTVPLVAGGSTVFPELHLSVLPTHCAALYFEDTRPDGTVDPRTLHGGSPILQADAEKWACNVWFREKPFRKVEPAKEGTQAVVAKIPNI